MHVHVSSDTIGTCVQQLRRWTEGAQDGGSTRWSLNTCLSVSHSLSVRTVIPHQCVCVTCEPIPGQSHLPSLLQQDHSADCHCILHAESSL